MDEFGEYEIDVSSLEPIGQMVQLKFTDFLDVLIDVSSLGKVGLRISNPSPFLAGLKFYPDDLITFLSERERVRR